MSDLQEMELGGIGLAFVKQSFLENGLSLGREVLRNLPLVSGRCVTILPASVSFDRAVQFTVGGVGKRSAIEWEFARLLSMQVGRVSRGVFVAENILSRCQDRPPSGDPVDRFCVGQEVYDYVEWYRASPDGILTVIRRADASFSLNAIVSNLPPGVTLPKGKAQARIGVLSELAPRAMLLMVRAYDGEGFVVWMRTPTSDSKPVS